MCHKKIGSKSHFSFCKFQSIYDLCMTQTFFNSQEKNLFNAWDLKNINILTQPLCILYPLVNRRIIISMSKLLLTQIPLKYMKAMLRLTFLIFLNDNWNFILRGLQVTMFKIWCDHITNVTTFEYSLGWKYRYIHTHLRWISWQSQYQGWSMKSPTSIILSMNLIHLSLYDIVIVR